jgi:hypothetical protein
MLMVELLELIYPCLVGWLAGWLEYPGHENGANSGDNNGV